MFHETLMASRKLIAAVIAIAVVAFVFFVPIVPTTGSLRGIYDPLVIHIYFYRSVSTLFTPIGTSLWGWHYYFAPHPQFLGAAYSPD
jgi:hypothetical protein